MASMPWRTIAGAAFIALLFWVGSASAEPTFPVLTGRVVDDANLLSSIDKAQLTADLKALEDKSSDQVVVVTVPALPTSVDVPWRRTGSVRPAARRVPTSEAIAS